MSGGDLKTNYYQDMRIFHSRFYRYWLGVLLLGLIVFPFLSSSYLVHIVNMMAISSIVALSLNMLSGYTGLFSLGHAALYAGGAFATAFFAVQVRAPFPIVLIAGLGVGGVLGLVMGLPALRLKAFYLVLGTLAMHFVIIYLAGLYQKSTEYSWGFAIPRPSLGFVVLDSPIKWYFFNVVVTGLVAVFCINLLRSRIGRAWIAIRDRDMAAESLGIHVGRYKLLSFAFSGALAGLAGSISGYYFGIVTQETYTFWLGISFVSMIVVGGLGSIFGSFLGAAVITVLTYNIGDFLALLHLPSQLVIQTGAFQQIIYGALIIVFMMVEPAGLVGIWRNIKTFFELWPFKYRRAIATRR